MTTTNITVCGREFSVTTITPGRGHKWYRLTSDCGECFRTLRPYHTDKMLLVADSGHGVATGFGSTWLTDSTGELAVVS